MFVSSNIGTVQCITFLEYEQYLKECIHHIPDNEIWCNCSDFSEGYPCLSIVVKGQNAVVNYFSEDNTEMFVSVGDICKDGSIEFEGGQYEIAPNQWGYGRPSLAEIWEILNKTESMPNVAWVRVILHDDTEIEECNGVETLNLYGDSIALCTTAQPTEIENLINCSWLCSDGVIVIKESELNVFSRIPPVPEGFRCLEILWD